MGIILPKQYVEEKALQHEYYDYKEIGRKIHNPSKYEPQKKQES